MEHPPFRCVSETGDVSADGGIPAGGRKKKGIEDIDFTGAKVREYDEALRALQLMGEELTDSLQAQWEMEHRQRESIIQLSHKLKTPLTVIQGNAELLAEDEGITGEQKAQLDAILRSTGETRNYLTRIRAEVQTPLKLQAKTITTAAPLR